MTKIDERLKELRDLRTSMTNEYNTKMSEVQMEIDRLECDKYNLFDLIGKYVKCVVAENQSNSLFRSDTCIIYILVKDVKRLFRGPKLCGKTLYVNKDADGNIIQASYNDDSCVERLKWEECNEYQVISKEEMDKAIEEVKDKLTNIF